MKHVEIIKNLRVDSDYKQYEMAKELGINPKTYCAYENGFRTIPFDVLSKILNKFNMSLDYMYSHTPIKNYEDISPINLDKYHERIYKIRKEKHYSQAKMASLIGVNQQTLSEYERGNIDMPLDTLNIFCEVNNISLDYMLGRIDNKIKLH